MTGGLLKPSPKTTCFNAMTISKDNQRKLPRLLDDVSRAVEDLLLTGLTTASQATRQTLDVSFREVSRKRLLRLGSTLRAANEELGRFTAKDPNFSKKRLTFFLNRAWMLCRGLSRALRDDNQEEFDRLLWIPATQPVKKLEVVTLGVAKKEIKGAYCAFEFRFRTIAKVGKAIPKVHRLTWSCIFPMKPGTEIPAEGFLHLPQKQKFKASDFLKGNVLAIASAGVALDGFGGGRITLGDDSTVEAGDAFDDWPSLQTWDNEADDKEADDVSKPESLAPAQEFNEDQLFAESGFYQKLAEVAGYKSWSEGWDSIFETGDWSDVEEFRYEMASFCAAVRATSSPQRIAADGTLPRERFMWQTIRETLKKSKVKPQDAMVVCGGFHLFLDREDPEPPPVIPEGTVYTSVIPYSFFRTSELSGYGAGNRAPQFYQTAWDLTASGHGDDILAEHIVAVLKRARRDGEHVSSADAISVSQHARMLAQLRGRKQPVLDDIQDAIVTCCCKGNPEDEGIQLLKAIDAVNIGTKVGRVTPKLGQLPIVNDFYGQIDELQLDEVMRKEKQMSLTLDKRETADEYRSVFLHRLCFLDIPIAKHIDAPNAEFASGTLFKERWALKWSPKVEPALIEQNLYGDTIEAAVLARLHEEFAKDEGHAGRTCEHLRRSIEMDLPNLAAEVQDACSNAIDTDARFVSLTTALGHLTVIERYARHRGLRREEIYELIVRCFDRACFSIPEVCSVPEEQQAEVVHALLALADAMIKSAGDDFDRVLFAENVRSAADSSTVPYLRGAFLGMLAEIRELSPQEPADEVSAYSLYSTDQRTCATEESAGRTRTRSCTVDSRVGRSRLGTVSASRQRGHGKGARSEARHCRITRPAETA